MLKLSPLSVAIFSTLAATHTQVSANEDPEAVSPERITVTATRTERYFMETPASVAIVDAEQIQRSSSESIADVLQDVPGIQVTDAATPGMKRITLRGESSLRVAILVDGQEITDHSTYGAPLLLDPVMVERVEVIRGTSSVLYGGKALGGVINIITKKGGSEVLQGHLSASYHSATKGKQYAASVYGQIGEFDYRLSASDNDHEDRDTPDGRIDETRFGNDSLMFYLGKETDEHKFAVNFEQFNLNSEIATGMPGFSLNMPQRDREKISGLYTYTGPDDVFKRFHLDVYDQTIDRNFVQHLEQTIPIRPPMAMELVVDTNIQEKLETQGVNSQLDFALGEDHYLIMGLQLVSDDLNKATDNRTQRTMVIPGAPARPDITETLSVESASLDTKALYMQDEWRLNDKTLFTFGGRQYWVDAKLNESSRDGLALVDNSDSKFIGSAAVNYAVDDNTNIRMVASQGYHYPTLIQVATGATAAGSYINPNASLKPEESDNLEVGYRYFSDSWLIDASVFYTSADNYITTRTCAGSGLSCVDSTRDSIYINANKAKTAGSEISVEHQLNESFSPYVNLTLLSREETYGEFVTRNTGTPDYYGKLGVKYQGNGSWLKNYYVDAYVRAAGSADVAFVDGTREEYKSWNTFNLAFGSTFGENDNYQLNIELSNIFDKKYSPANETLTAPGFSTMAKFSASF